MIKPKLYSRPPKTNYEYQDGESIEDKVRRITENNEPITDGAPIIYTNREDGVLPAYNIRTLILCLSQHFSDVRLDFLHLCNPNIPLHIVVILQLLAVGIGFVVP
jgi:hypothetical protein